MCPIHCKSQILHWHCLLQNNSVSDAQRSLRETSIYINWAIVYIAKHFTVQTKTRTLGKSQGRFDMLLNDEMMMILTLIMLFAPV